MRAVAEGQWLGYLVPGLSTIIAIVLLTLNKKLKFRSHCLSSPKCIVSTTIIMLAGDWKPCDVLTSCSWRCSIKLSYVMYNLVLRSPRNCARLRKWNVTGCALRGGGGVRWSPLTRDPGGEYLDEFLLGMCRWCLRALYPFIVYSVANKKYYRCYLSHFWANV